MKRLANRIPLILALKSLSDYIEKSSIKAKTIKINYTTNDIKKFVEKQSPAFRRIFKEYWETQGDTITQAEVTEMLSTGVVPMTLEAKLNSNTKIFGLMAFSPMVNKTVTTAGQTTATTISNALRSPFVFDSTGQRVINYVRDQALSMTVDLTSNQMGVLRGVLDQSITNGWGSVKTGRAMRESIGLTTKQFDRFVTPYSKNLKLSGIPQEQIDKLVSRRIRNLTRQRANTIARTETSRAYNFANEESIKQAMDAGLISGGWKIWRTAGDDRVREEHMDMEGERVRIGETFSNGSEYPDDINERCVVEYVLEA
jgi:hypothetical protein